MKNVKTWKIDKLVFWKTNPKTPSKVEFYSFFRIKDYDKIMKNISKNFNFIIDTKKFPKQINPILNLHWKYSLWNWKILDIKNTNKKYFYYNDFCKVISHRWFPFLVRIYRQFNNKINYFKLEITYFKFTKNYNNHCKTIAYKTKAINEIIKKINNKVNPIKWENIEDFSWKITYNNFVEIVSNKYEWEKKNKLVQILKN